jgi:hypothetical protein
MTSRRAFLEVSKTVTSANKNQINQTQSKTVAHSHARIGIGDLSFARDRVVCENFDGMTEVPCRASNSHWNNLIRHELGNLWHANRSYRRAIKCRRNGNLLPLR